MATIESERFYRIVTLLVDGASMVLRKRLSMFVRSSGCSLAIYLLSNQRPILELHTRRILRQEEKDKLFPPPGSPPPDIETFDLTLLVMMLKDVCNVQPPELDEVENLRRYRNDVYAHTSHASLVENKFQRLWSDISGTILNLAKKTKDNAFLTKIQTFIDKIRTGPIEISSSLDILKDWFTRDLPAIKEDIKDLQKNVAALTAGLNSLESNHEQLKQNTDSDISSLALDEERTQKQQQSLQTDIQNLKRDNKCFKASLKRLSVKEQKSKQACAKRMRRSVGYRRQVDSIRGDPTEQDFNRLRNTLIEIYTKKYAKVRVSPMNEEITVDIDELYTEVVMVEEKKDNVDDSGSIGRKEIPVQSLKEVFFKDNERLESIYLLASAGKGKTTFCYKVIDLWCKAHKLPKHEDSVPVQKQKDGLSEGHEQQSADETSINQARAILVKAEENQVDADDQLNERTFMLSFDFLFFVPLRHVAGVESILNAFNDSTLEEYPDLHRIVNEALKQSPEKVLIICDGLDEHQSIPSRKNLRGCSVLTTTRPWKYDMARSRYKADGLFELKGLDTKNINDLIQRVLTSVYKDETHDITLNCREAIEGSNLIETVKIPLLLIYTVHLWYTNKQLSPSITLNMVNIVACILGNGKDRLENLVNISELRTKWKTEEQPLCFLGTDLEDYGGLLLSVAKLAFHGLTASRKDEALVFKERSLLSYFNCSPEEEFKICLKIGLLSKSDMSSVVRKEISVTFYHKLFQEFFSAVWAVYSEEAFHKLCEHCCSLSILEDMQNVYIFMCGIDPRFGSKFSKHVADLCSSESLERFWRRDSASFWFDSSISRLTRAHLKCANAIKHSSKFSDEALCVTDIELHCNSKLVDSVIPDITLDESQMLLLTARNTLTCLKLGFFQLESDYEWFSLLKLISYCKNLRMLSLSSVEFGIDNDDDDHDDGDFYNDYIMNQLDFEIPSTCKLERVTFAAINFSLVPLLKMLVRTNTLCRGTNDTESTGTLLHLQIEDRQITTAEWCLLTRIVNESQSLHTFEMTQIETESKSTTLFSIYPPLVPCSLKDVTIVGRRRASDIIYYAFPFGQSCETKWVPLYLFLRRLMTAITTTCFRTCAETITSTLVNIRLENIVITLHEWRLLEEIVNVAPDLEKLHLEEVTYEERCIERETLPISTNSPCRLHSLVITGVGSSVFATRMLPYGPDFFTAPLLQMFHHLEVERHGPYLETDASGTAWVGSSLTELRIEFIRMTMSEWTLLLKVLCKSSYLETLSLVNIIVDNTQNNQGSVNQDPCSSPGDSAGKKEKGAAIIDDHFADNRYPALRKVHLEGNIAPIEQILSMLEGASGVKQLDMSGKIGRETEFIAMILGMQGLEKMHLKDMYFGTEQLDLSKHVQLGVVKLTSVDFGEQEVGIVISDCVKVLGLHYVKMSSHSWHELFGFPLDNVHLIKCGCSNVTQLSSTATTKIKNLELSEMDFHENILDFSKCVSLQELNLTGVKFRTHLNIEKNTCLRVLNLNSVNMSLDTWINFFESIHDLSSLESIHLTKCNIEPDKIKWPKHFPPRALQTSE